MTTQVFLKLFVFSCGYCILCFVTRNFLSTIVSLSFVREFLSLCVLILDVVSLSHLERYLSIHSSTETIKGYDPPNTNISYLIVFRFPLSIVYCTLQYKSFVTSMTSPFFFFYFTSFSFNFYVDIHYSPLNH